MAPSLTYLHPLALLPPEQQKQAEMEQAEGEQQQQAGRRGEGGGAGEGGALQMHRDPATVGRGNRGGETPTAC